MSLGALALLFIAVQPGWAKPAADVALQIDAGPITDLIGEYKTLLKTIGQAVLGVYVGYQVIVVGIGSLSGAAVKKIVVALASIVGLQMLDSLLLSPAQDVNSSSSIVAPSPETVAAGADMAMTVFITLT